VAGRIRSTEKSNDLIGNQTHDLLACNRVPQPTALLHPLNFFRKVLFFVHLRNLNVINNLHLMREIFDFLELCTLI
jgi:hypothetical protein